MILKLPQSTHRKALAWWSVAISAIGIGQLWKASGIETLLGLIFLLSGALLAAAAMHNRVHLVALGFMWATTAFLLRAGLGQLIPDIAPASRIILSATWLLLAWCAWERAKQAYILMRMGREKIAVVKS